MHTVNDMTNFGGTGNCETRQNSLEPKQGRSQTFSFGGASFATRGAVNGLCSTFRKRPEKFWGGSGTPLAPPLNRSYNK